MHFSVILYIHKENVQGGLLYFPFLPINKVVKLLSIYIPIRYIFS